MLLEQLPPFSGKKAKSLTEMEYVPAPRKLVINDESPLPPLLLDTSKFSALSNSLRIVSPDVTVLVVTVPGFAKENVKKSKSRLLSG